MNGLPTIIFQRPNRVAILPPAAESPDLRFARKTRSALRALRAETNVPRLITSSCMPQRNKQHGSISFQPRGADTNVAHTKASSFPATARRLARLRLDCRAGTIHEL